MAYVHHRRLPGVKVPYGQRPSAAQSSSPSWGERCLSLLLVAAAIALGVAVLGSFVSLTPLSAKLVQLTGLGVGASVADGAAAATAAGGAAAKATKVRTFPEPDAEAIERLRKAAKVLDPEVMQHVPPAFDAAVKNPCWTDDKQQFRCLPYFYITGMFHAGALSLSDKLSKHPDVLTDVCTGCQFWGEEGKLMGFYLDSMATAAKAIQAAPSTKVLMDSSPSTFAFYWAAGGKAHRGFQQSVGPCHGKCVEAMHQNKTPSIPACMDTTCYPAARAADKARANAAGISYDLDSHNPLLVRAVYGARPPRLLLVARDPIDRLYSAFHGYPHYHGKYGKTAAGFTAYVKEQVGAFRTCAADHGAAACALLFEALGAREEAVYFHADQLMRGMYGLFLEIWLRFLPPQHWLVLHSDDLFTQPKPTLGRVIRFLGITPANDTTLAAMASAGNPKSYTAGAEPMEPEARRLLLDFYRPYNTLLAELTGDARFLEWNREQPAPKAAAAAAAS